MGAIKNLICLENDKASIIRVVSDKFEFIKRDGEIEIPIMDDFWDWWKRVVSYIDEDPVDICFIYDKEYPLLQENEILKNNIINTENSNWQLDHIKNFYWQLRPMYMNLVIIGLQEQEFYLNSNQCGTARKVFTNLDFEGQVLQPAEAEKAVTEKEAEEPAEVIADEEYSVFAKFYIDMIRRERG